MKFRNKLILSAIIAVLGISGFGATNVHAGTYDGVHHVRFVRDAAGHYGPIDRYGNALDTGGRYYSKSYAYKFNHPYHVNRVSQWYRNHTYRNRVHYATSNHISSHHYQTAFADVEDDDGNLAVTNNYHSLIKGINSSFKYKISKIIKVTTPLRVKSLEYLSGDYNGNGSDVYSIKYNRHKYYYADSLLNKGNSDSLQNYNASYYKGTIYSWVKPYEYNAVLKHGQRLHNHVEWDYEDPYSYHDDYYKYSNGYWHEESDSDDVPEYVQDS